MASPFVAIIPPHILVPTLIGVATLAAAATLAAKSVDQDIYVPKEKHVIKVEEVSLPS